MSIQLEDSSEFHGSEQREWNYKMFKLKRMFVTPRYLKYAFYLILWFIMGRISLHYQLQGVFVILTGFALIFCNLGERKEGTMSAYSVFNNKFYNVIGTFTASDVDNMFIQRNNPDQSEPQKQSIDLINEDKSEFDGLSEDQMMAKLNKLGNKQCFCNSGRKYKKCHYYLQQRAKQQEEDEEKQLQQKKKKQH